VKTKGGADEKPTYANLLEEGVKKIIILSAFMGKSKITYNGLEGRGAGGKQAEGREF